MSVLRYRRVSHSKRRGAKIAETDHFLTQLTLCGRFLSPWHGERGNLRPRMRMRRGISVIVKRSRFTKAKISARRRGKEGDGRFLGPGLAAGRGPRATFRFRDVMIRERPRPEKGSGCLLIRNPRISSVVFHADRIDYRSGLRRLRMEPAILSLSLRPRDPYSYPSYIPSIRGTIIC